MAFFPTVVDEVGGGKTLDDPRAGGLDMQVIYKPLEDIDILRAVDVVLDVEGADLVGEVKPSNLQAPLSAHSL